MEATGKWKLNVDGSFLPTILCGGTGGILRDYQESFKVAFVIPIPTPTSAKQVEVWAIKEGMKLLKTLNIVRVTVETDCLEAMKAISDVQGTHMGLEGFIYDIREYLSSTPGISIRHISRTCNSVAHRLAATQHMKLQTQLFGWILL
ncbi:hypothetical protein ACLB2K_053133 [Fragaria x ananassa]